MFGEVWKERRGGVRHGGALLCKESMVEAGGNQRLQETYLQLFAVVHFSLILTTELRYLDECFHAYCLQKEKKEPTSISVVVQSLRTKRMRETMILSVKPWHLRISVAPCITRVKRGETAINYLCLTVLSG